LKGITKMRAGAAIAAAGAILSCAGTAQAQRPASLGSGAPIGQMGVQLYDWSQYISNSAGEVNPPAPTTSGARLERVMQYLQSKKIRNVELYGYPGNPFPGTNPATPLNTAGLQSLRALGDSYGLRFVSRHGNLAEPNWDQEIQASQILGQEVIGAADPPGIGNLTYQGALTLSETLNRLGKRSVEAGVGPVYFHNHASSFNRKFNDAGVMKYPWEVLMDHTDPRYVKAQIDIFWIASGVSNDPAIMADIFTRYRSRLVSVHVKDGVNPTPTAGTGNLRALGDGAVNFAPLFDLARNNVRWYLYEYDPVTPGNNGGYNPFTTTDRSLAALQGAPAGVTGTRTPSFTKVAAGTAAASNTTVIPVTNLGDGPLVFTSATPAITATTDDGGPTTAGDFAVVANDCAGKTLAPAVAAVADDPSTPANEAAPAVPAGTCTVTVGFKPSRTNYTSTASLALPTNADDAVDRVFLSATSTGEAVSTVGGNVPSMLSLTLPAQGGSFGTFMPGMARTYETALSGSITSTAGDATLTVADTSTTFPGHLVNGAYALPQPLNVKASTTAVPGNAFAPLPEATNTPLTLLTYSGATTGDLVTIGFRQAIGATDVLRSGSYSKSLTFTLSTTTP
jgi:sugar phosphate isomerase/epimerase